MQIKFIKYHMLIKIIFCIIRSKHFILQVIVSSHQNNMVNNNFMTSLARGPSLCMCVRLCGCVRVCMCMCEQKHRCVTMQRITSCPLCPSSSSTLRKTFIVVNEYSRRASNESSSVSHLPAGVRILQMLTLLYLYLIF